MLTKEELLRYSRHVVIPEIGIEGQEKIKSASVLIVGAGGLGSPAAMYVAAAGIGKIGIADDDVVDVTNLQRQLLHTQNNIGSRKTDSARGVLSNLNPSMVIETYDTRLTSRNAMEILSGYDVIIDGSDNFPTRYLINDTCVLLNKPDVYGSIYRFEGQLSTFYAKDGPCYRCLYPDPPLPELIPNCADGGVLGAVSGIIGSMQALEAIKFIVGEKTLQGTLLLFDGLTMSSDRFTIHKNSECPVCGSHPSIHGLIDYDAFCGMSQNSAVKIQSLSIVELKKRFDRKDDIQLLDVREPEEVEIVSIGGTAIPLRELSERLNELDKSKELVVYCKTGERSAVAADLLRRSGFTNVLNLEGGIKAWVERIDNTLRLY